MEDTEPHDAEIHAEAAARRPGRVARVTLRRAGRTAPRAPVAARRPAGVRVDFLDDYSPILRELTQGDDFPGEDD